MPQPITRPVLAAALLSLLAMAVSCVGAPLASTAASVPVTDAPQSDLPPVSTFSIVALDPATGDLGIAVTSKFLAVGSVVPFAEAGVGAVATQARANVTYGPEVLRLLRDGKTAAEPWLPSPQRMRGGRNGNSAWSMHAVAPQRSPGRAATTGQAVAPAPTARCRATSWWMKKQSTP